jgi:aspartyl/asparaginyl-tRNA synthetase
MMLNKGPYDYMVENYNKLRQVEAGVVSESLLYESVNGMMHMEKYTYLDYETAKAEREEKMVKQKELNKQIIEAWNQHTSKDIQENPSKFFQNKDPQG